MKKIIIAMAAIAAAFTMASCNKELVEPENNPTQGNCIITASTESNLTKTSLSGDDTNGYEVVWSEGDSFVIGGNTFTLTAGEGTINGTFEGNAPADNKYTVYYPSTYDGETWPVSQTYTKDNITGSPMKAEVTITDGKASESIKFKNGGGILRLTVKGTAKVTSIKVSAAELSKAITLNCGDGVELDNTDGTVFHIAMPAGSYSKTSIQFKTTSGSICTKTLKSSTLDIKCSEITTASFSTSFITTGSAEALPGMFSVGKNRHIQFSQGNLVCDISGETPKWGVYENQYGYAAAYSSTLISLFTWGYDSDWSILASGTTNPTNKNLGGNNYLPKEKDWGSQIGDGKTWRTLTMEEWKYLFETRTNAKDKYGYATVGGVYGLIILPDIFTDPLKNGGSGAFAPVATTGYDANVYTTGGNWEAMEAAGAVFLPAAGYRDGISLSYVGDYGFYWSASYDTNNGPYGLTFYSSLVDPDASGNVAIGKSVRLVTGCYGEATINGNITYVQRVQLWEDGPKFAEYNMGVTDGKAESYGGLYTWADNIASAQWGDSWRMPARTEFDGLIENCELEEITKNDVNGLLCTGRGNYEDNSIFLPFGGYIDHQFSDEKENENENKVGDYWSSTPNGSNEAYRLYFTGTPPRTSMLPESRNYGFSVRAVLVEE